MIKEYSGDILRKSLHRAKSGIQPLINNVFEQVMWFVKNTVDLRHIHGTPVIYMRRQMDTGTEKQFYSTVISKINQSIL